MTISHEQAAWIVNHASAIGEILANDAPPDTSLGYPTIPDDRADEIADSITLVVAQILQSWLDAGSERENTVEELGDPIREHVRSWTTSKGGE